MRSLFDTSDSRTLFFQRVVLGLVIGAHGLQKAFGLFGGFGFEGTMQFFTQTLHVPAPLAVLVILGETAGAVALLAGAGARIAAAGVAAIMLGAIVMVHAPYGFFMNWSGTLGGEGYELHILALGLCIPLIVRGAGAHSIDRTLARLSQNRNVAFTPAMH